MGVKLAAASGGSIELVPTNTASNFTVTVPASTGTMATAESTLTQFNASGSAPVYACRAWVNFNGTGTVAIRASGNVSSITDNGVGDYTINFTTAMQDVDYALAGSADEAGSASVVTLSLETLLVGSARILVTRTAAGRFDSTLITTSIFR